jgi:hypothetical protein
MRSLGFVALTLMILRGTLLQADVSIVCLYYPVLADDPYMWFVGEEFMGGLNCTNGYACFASTDIGFDDWPETCPYCADNAQGTTPIVRATKGLRKPIGRCESLCSLVPVHSPDGRGGFWSPRRGVTVLGCRNIQVMTENGRTVSVRLFDARLSPRVAGIPGAKDRIVHIGFESDQPISQECRPYRCRSDARTPFQGALKCCGFTYTVLTSTALTADASQASSPAERR